MKQPRPYPRLTVTKKGERWLSSGHLWVFESDVAEQPPAENGAIVDVLGPGGAYLGTGLLSHESKIRARIVSRNANDRFDQAFWDRKAAWAWGYRRTALGPRSLPGCEPDTACCRVLFSEADGFPGMTVDRYGDVLVAQPTTAGMDRLRPQVYAAVLKALAEDPSGPAIRGLYERADGTVREKEGLDRHQGWWLPESGSPADGLLPSHTTATQVRVQENGITYTVDLARSQKTGFFLDQKYNRRAVGRLAPGRRVLDCFSHVGPFGLNAAKGGAEFVRCVDISQTACDLALANAEANGLAGTMAFTCANVFEYLDALIADKRRLREDGGPFDLIVLDPPAFTKSRSTQGRALRGYREINNQALRLLPRGGYLATCSCSQHMPAELLKQAVAEAAHDARVTLRQVEERQQAPDHPILLDVPETHYLDFLIFQAV